MAMIKMEIKYEKEPECELRMSKLMEDLISIQDAESGDTAKGKSLVLQFESINLKDSKIEFACLESWDKKDNFIRLVKAIEAFDWVNELVEIKRTKK